MAFVEQIVSEANNVNVLLDELKHTSRIRPLRRRELLQRALGASVRGVRVLAQEPLITDSQAYLVGFRAIETDPGRVTPRRRACDGS